MVKKIAIKSILSVRRRGCRFPDRCDRLKVAVQVYAPIYPRLSCMGVGLCTGCYAQWTVPVHWSNGLVHCIKGWFHEATK